MARAADNTIAFVKEWIEGKLTRRQYMHYYVVKTPHAQFLMKANEQPDLVAIMDSKGHIFIPDNVLCSYYVTDERATRNPFLALIADGYQFPYSMIMESSFTSNHASKNLSKWKTLDLFPVLNKDSNITVNLALIQIGDNRYITEIESKNKTVLKLSQWIDYEDVKSAVFRSSSKSNNVQPYCKLREVIGKPNTMDEVRSSYLAFAGDQAEQATVTEDWIIIPTDKKFLNEVADSNIRDIFKTRPMPYHYGLTSDLINVEAAWKRTDYPFNPSTLGTYRASGDFVNIENVPSGRAFINSGVHWRECLRSNLDSEVADNLIQYIDEDDVWLQENGYAMTPFAHGRKFKEDLFNRRVNGYIMIIEEENPSLMSKHVAYIKGNILDGYGNITTKLPTFAKLIPAPHSSQTYQLEEFINYVCG